MLNYGATVPLALQLYDGREDLGVTCIVLDPDKAVVFEGRLLHVRGGLYESREFRMPDADFIIAQYVVMDGDLESQDYGRSSETFYRNPEPIDVSVPVKTEVRQLLEEFTPKHDDFFHGKIETFGETDDFIEGKIKWN